MPPQTPTPPTAPPIRPEVQRVLDAYRARRQQAPPAQPPGMINQAIRDLGTPANAVRVGGPLAGMAAGGAIGSAFGGVGAIPGALIGGILGGVGGGLGSEYAAHRLEGEESPTTGEMVGAGAVGGLLPLIGPMAKFGQVGLLASERAGLSVAKRLGFQKLEAALAEKAAASGTKIASRAFAPNLAKRAVAGAGQGALIGGTHATASTLFDEGRLPTGEEFVGSAGGAAPIGAAINMLTGGKMAARLADRVGARPPAPRLPRQPRTRVAPRPEPQPQQKLPEPWTKEWLEMLEGENPMYAAQAAAQREGAVAARAQGTGEDLYAALFPEGGAPAAPPAAPTPRVSTTGNQPMPPPPAQAAPVAPTPKTPSGRPGTVTPDQAAQLNLILEGVPSQVAAATPRTPGPLDLLKTQQQTGLAGLKEAAGLPRPLAGAKPRYGHGSRNFELQFEEPMDMATYILAQTKKSRQDAAYLKFVTEKLGVTEAQARTLGAQVRARIKSLAAGAGPDETLLTVPRSGTPAPPPQPVSTTPTSGIRKALPTDTFVSAAAVKAATPDGVRANLASGVWETVRSGGKNKYVQRGPAPPNPPQGPRS